MKARLVSSRQASRGADSRRRFALWRGPFAFALLISIFGAASSVALTPTQPPTPTTTPSGLEIEDLLGAYDIAIDFIGQETMTGEAQISQRDGGGISIAGSVRHPSGLPDPSVQLRGRLSSDGSIAVNGFYNTDGDIANQANGALIARRMGQNLRITGTVHFNGVRNGTLALTMAKQSASNDGGGGGGCAICADRRGTGYQASVLLLVGLFIALARARFLQFGSVRRSGRQDPAEYGTVHSRASAS